MSGEAERFEDRPSEEIAFVVGMTTVMLDDVAKAIAVHNGAGETFDDDAARGVLRDHARDILDKAFRYAQERRKRRAAV